MGGAFQKKLVGQTDLLTGFSAMLRYTKKNLLPKCLQMWQFCMDNVTKVGVAKHKVGGANLNVGGAVAPPTV